MTPFAGVGLLADIPHPLPPGADWIAFRAVGIEPPVWLAPDGPIVQAEGPDQLAAALRYGDQHPGAKALICNDTVRTWPGPEWACIPEAYTSTNPNATPDQMTRDFQGRGATVIAPCVLCSDEGTRWPLTRYLPSLRLAAQAGAVGASVFQYESMQPADFDALPEVAAVFDQTPPPPPPPPPPQPPSSMVVRAELERIARLWEKSQTGDLDRTRILLARRIVALENSDASWSKASAAVQHVLDQAEVPR